MLCNFHVDEQGPSFVKLLNIADGASGNKCVLPVSLMGKSQLLGEILGSMRYPRLASICPLHQHLLTWKL